MNSDTAPVFWLTARQFLDGKSIRVVALLAAVPVLLGGIEVIASGADANVRSFLGNSFNDLTIPTLLPLISLILASSALGNEISDRTLPYLALKPRSRMLLVLEKFLATFVIGTVIALAFLVVAWAVVGIAGSNLDVQLLLAMTASAILAIAGYAAAFTLLSLLITRVLMAGLLYVLIWESLLSGLIPGLRLLSIRHYAQSLYANVLSDPGVTISQQSTTATTLIVITALVGASLMFSWLRIQQMDLD